MSSEFLIAVPHELPKQDSLVNSSREGKMLDEDYTNNHLEQKLSHGVPQFSCIRNFPFNNSMKFCDMRVPDHTATKRHTLDDELDTRLPKLIKLQSKFTNYRSEAAVDMVDAVAIRSQFIKNDVNLGEVVENPSIDKSERTDVLVEETSLQQLANETLEACNSDHISVEAIGGHSCAAIENGSCTNRKSSDQEQDFLQMETENAVLKFQNRNDSSASLVAGQDCVTETENSLLNTEQRVFFAHEFVGAETEADEYHNVHESLSLSEFLICPTSFEQKESCDSLLHSVQKEETDDSSVTAAIDVSHGMEGMDAHVLFHNESEISGHASTSFDMDNKSIGKAVCDNTGNPLCKTRNLTHSAEVETSLNLLHNKIPGSDVAITRQAVVKEEFPIKEEAEEDASLRNRELDLDDDSVLQNLFMSLENHEIVTESVSTSTYGHHESSDTGPNQDLYNRTAYKENLAAALAKSAAAKEYSVKPHTENGKEITDRDLSIPDLISESGCFQVAGHYASRAQSCDEENNTQSLHQTLFTVVADTTPTQKTTLTQKTDASFEKVKKTREERLLTSLPRCFVAKIPATIVQSSENRSDFVATSGSEAENSIKPDTDVIHKHHKKELIKKFSSGLLKDGECDMSSSRDNRIHTETALKDSALPSTSTATTNEDKCIKDTIVISDSDDDSIIEFDVVKTCSKKRNTKSSHSGSLDKNTQSSSRKGTSSTRSSTNEESLGHQARNSVAKGSDILECIVVSDSDDESSNAVLSSRNRASNHSDEGVNVSDAESRVSVSDMNRRNRTESHGVIDLSGGRSPPAMPKSNSVVPSAGDSGVGVLATAFAAGDSQCSLADRLGVRNSGLDTNNSDTFTHIVAATITYTPGQSNLGRDGDVIDLSRRNLSPLITTWQNKTNSALDVLDLSGSDKKQQERHSVIKSVGTATDNKSATKDIAEDKDSSPAWSCPICFESLLSGRQSVSSTPCGHVFCTKCIEEAVNQFKKCPTCCRKVALKRVHKIFL
ncbi:uncharacterized protein LOC124544643 [Schistocerca americana]|uniref:uncharacterized protein LOC124544643 n=1 Tax=Schistocerca americana TaxID=7009 RepID=UPI001F502A22|nr:uncharacterized protein LOC124544643 [Schistocerca americana]XP_046979213.1 uncharacterized protein LOC124544643 [Schistocerca americana]XP_046979214.1 uncharacterized protein LOC124544643 [Schistocerca americana]